MPRRPLHTVSWEIRVDAGAAVARLTCLDTYTQRHVCCDVPLIAIPPLVSMLHELLDERPEYFAAYIVTRLDS